MSDRCVNCGALLPEGAKLCTSCGKIVTKNTRLRTEPVSARRPAPDVETSSRVYSHKPTSTAVIDRAPPEPEPEVRQPRPKRPADMPQHKKKKPAAGSKKGSKKAAKKSHGKAKFIIAVSVLVIVILLLLYMLIYMLKVGEAKKLVYEPETPFKMSYTTFGEAAEHFFEEPEWSYDLLSGEVTVEGVNKGTYYKYTFEDDKVTCVIVGKDVFEEKLTDEKEIDILVARMFV